MAFITGAFSGATHMINMVKNSKHHLAYFSVIKSTLLNKIRICCIFVMKQGKLNSM